MFRKPNIIINARTRTEYVDRNVTVTEKRAPTDESVRLLKEMERAAEDKIIDSIRVSDTHFECVVQSSLDVASDAFVMRAIFKLNGRRLEAEHTIQRCKASTQDRLDAAFSGLRDEVAKVISSEILRGAFMACVAIPLARHVRP